MDKKSPDAFRTISEVAEWLGVPTHVLRFWESRFAQVKPVKRAGGRRYYRPADMELLGGIRKLLHDDGMTIRGVQKLLREEGVKHVAAMSPSLDENAMVDVTPSNVVELRKPETAAEPVAEASDPAPVEEAELVTSPAQETDTIPPAPVAADPVPPAVPPTETMLEAPPPEMEPEPAPELAPDMPAVAEAPVDAPADPTPAPAQPPVQEPLAPAAPMQTGFDFGDAASTTEDLSQDSVLESSDAVEFHSHGAGFAPPPAASETAEAAEAAGEPTPPASASDDPQTAELGDDYDDPSDLPRLGAADLPLATGELGREAQAAMMPPADEATSETPAPVAGEPLSEAEEEITATPPAPDVPADTPAFTAEAAPIPQVDTPPPLSGQDPAPVETVVDAPAPAPEPESVEAEQATESPTPALDPAPEPVESQDAAPEPTPEPTPAPVDISHIPADPMEDDISPAGPSLAARMRRLAARTPQGSPAQMRALGDRLQELSGRMKRDAPRRGMQ